MKMQNQGKPDYTLYLCTDRDLMSAATVESSVEQALSGGCSLVQLREKELLAGEFYALALRVKAITDRFGVPLIINDRLDIALAMNAGGVHLGQSDLPAAAVRPLLERDKLLGVSASSLAEAVKAQADGADYIGIGAMYATDTKTDAKPVSMDELRAIRAAVSIPIVVIGGINERTLPDFRGTGIDGIAVISAVVGAPDIAASARRLRAEMEEIFFQKA